MASVQRLRLYSPTGDYLRTLTSWRSIDCVLAENQASPLTITLLPEYPDDLFARHSRIVYERTPSVEYDYGIMKLVGNTTWLVQGVERSIDQNGKSSIILNCEHPNTIIGSRVVAYEEGTSQAEKSDIGSDVMYDIANENFVTATDSARNLSSSHFILDPRPGPTFGANLDKSISYRNILTIFQELCKSTAQQGAYCGFEVYTPVPPGPYHLRFYSKYRGTNRGLTSGQPFVLHSTFVETGGFGVSRTWQDWSGTVSFVYAGGSGKQDERVVDTAQDDNLIKQSPFGRVEYFRGLNSQDIFAAASEAEQTLREFRPRRAFSSSFGNQTQYVYDAHYTWGDIIVAQFSAPTIVNGAVTSWVNYSFDVRIDPVHIVAQRFFDENDIPLVGEHNEVQERETLEIHLRSVEST